MHLWLSTNIKSIRNNNVNMIIAVGRDSDNADHVQTARAPAAKLGCENVVFPGHHDVSYWMPEEFANAIWHTLEAAKTWQEGCWGKGLDE